MNYIVPQNVIHYAAQECSWQGSGELSVGAMLDAWAYARATSIECFQAGVGPRFQDVIELGRLIEPVKNKTGLRNVGVAVGNSLKMKPELVPNALASLCDALPWEPVEAETQEWFRQFEEIHPFVDGNGRTGSLLYNWIRGTLANPVHPPNLWGDYRRSYEAYPEALNAFDAWVAQQETELAFQERYSPSHRNDDL